MIKKYIVALVLILTTCSLSLGMKPITPDLKLAVIKQIRLNKSGDPYSLKLIQKALLGNKFIINDKNKHFVDQFMKDQINNIINDVPIQTIEEWITEHSVQLY